MSWEHSKLAAHLTIKGDVTAKCVLLILAEAASDTGETYLSQETIAERCGTKRETVNRAMSRLQKLGLIIRARRKRGDGYRTSDTIKLALCDAKSCDLKSHENGSYVTLTRTLCDANGTAESSVNRQKEINVPKVEKGQSERKLKSTYPADFESLWLAYPHFAGRSDKRAALTAWAKLGGEDRAGLVLAVCNFANSPQAAKDGGQFVKGFHSWITGERWRDFAQAATSTSTTGPVAIDWQARLDRFKADRTWLASWGEKPDQDGCAAPADLLMRYGYGPRSLRVINGGAA